ncbi:MAG: PilZ domain-containing protein [Desulfobacterales bacterium]|jgi:hypothetical protein
MKNKEGLIERRKHKRFKVREGAFAVLRSDYNKLGQIKDISEGGLAFQFLEDGKQTKDSLEVEIFSTLDDFYMKKLPVRTVLDFELDNPVASNSTPMRQLSMKFGKLNHPQKLLLGFFIQKYTYK